MRAARLAALAERVRYVEHSLRESGLELIARADGPGLPLPRAANVHHFTIFVEGHVESFFALNAMQGKMIVPAALGDLV
jgi:hypothetical protein